MLQIALGFAVGLGLTLSIVGPPSRGRPAGGGSGSLPPKQPPGSGIPELPPGGLLVGTQNGRLVPIPAGWKGRVATNGKGIVFQKPGSQGKGNQIRVMDANKENPSGKLVYANAQGQRINPATGQPGSLDNTHVSLDYEGSLLGFPKWQTPTM